MTTVMEQKIKTNDPAAHLTAKLARVRLGTQYALHFPDVVKEPTGRIDERTNKPEMRVLYAFGEETYRGGPGYVVDWSHPLERLWCKGQEHKLENVPDDELAQASPSPLGHPQAILAMAQPAKDEEKKKLAEKQAAADAARKNASAAAPTKRFKETEGS